MIDVGLARYLDIVCINRGNIVAGCLKKPQDNTSKYLELSSR